MNAQRATKYFSPQMFLFFMNQVEGSPLLPRDVMTMMLYNRLYAFDLDDGRTLWPMPAIFDVSETLDVITKIEGKTLIRGKSHWEPVTAPGPTSATKWTVLEDFTISAAKSEHIIKDIGPWNDLMVTVQNISTTVSGQRRLQFSVDNGFSFFTAAGDYLRWNADGGSSSDSSAVFHSTNSTNPRNGIVSVTGNNSGVPPIIKLETLNGITEIFTPSLLPINALRISNTTGGNLTGGRIIAMGR